VASINKRIILTSFAFVIVFITYGQPFTMRVLTADINSSIRGLSVVNDQIAWFSGTNGTAGQTTDGGMTWNIGIIKGFEKMDFRSLYAFSEKEAVVANAGSPAYILRTEDGGATWATVYTNDNPGCFFDGMDFWDKKNGIIYGDPLDSRMFLMITNDGGKTWTVLPPESRPAVTAGEASFAASGTGIRCYGKNRVVMVTGGTVSRLHISEDKGRSWRSLTLPVLQGDPTSGAFSVTFRDDNNAVIVGGDYVRDTLAVKHVFYTSNAGETWQAPVKPTGGFRECVFYYDEKTLFAIGPGGSDFSTDGGRNWKTLSDEKGFHVAAKARRGKMVIAAGNRKIAIFNKS